MNRHQLARDHQRELGFTPQDAVRWLAPSELARAGLKAVLAAVFADYADKREIQAGLDSGLVTLPGAEPGSAGPLWFDYTADLGDGFDATFTVASLLAAEALDVPGVADPLPRGRLLVLGGDEVYPTASATAYEDRTTGPYRAALPHAEEQPVLLALPGNHDWYDGLTSFLRIFTQRRSIGGWRTVQSRSYFTLQLPHGWWLAGLDTQFESYIDEPQLDYFESTLTANLQPGDGVILCSATPTWVKSCEGDPDAFNALHWFEKNYIRSRRVPGTERRDPTGAEVRLWLTGDSHHYSRYTERPKTATDVGGRAMVTCGLGGAFMSATHQLPRDIEVLPEMSRSRDADHVPATFLRVDATYPDQDESRRLSRRLAHPWRPEWLLRRNPGLFWAAGGLHLLLFLLLLLLFGQGSIPLREGRGRVVSSYLTATAEQYQAFGATVFSAVAIGGALAWLAVLLRRKRLALPVAAAVAVLLQVCVMLLCFIGSAVLLRQAPDLENLPDWAVLAYGCAFALGVGGVLGVAMFGIFAVSSSRGGPRLWQMSGQAIEDGKGFLRIRLTPDGNLTVHPLVVDRVHRDWTTTRLTYPADPDNGWTRPPITVPRPLGDLPRPRLIEDPFVITRTPVPDLPAEPDRPESARTAGAAQAAGAP